MIWKKRHKNLSKISTYMEKNTTIKIIKRKKIKRKPWITKGLVKITQEKNNVYKIMRNDHKSSEYSKKLKYQIKITIK